MTGKHSEAPSSVSKEQNANMNEAITHEGLQLVRAWVRAKADATQAREALYRANDDEREAMRAFANWMAPQVIKPKPGEKISIWVGDSLFQLEVGGVITAGEGNSPGHSTSDELTVRFQGSKFHELA
ncbi:MAG: hypothetical protein ACREUT_02215 [Steroidobacteraceae bacterium]